MADAIAKILGERCPDHDPGCLLCQAWDEYDALRAEHDRLTGRGVKPLEWKDLFEHSDDEGHHFVAEAFGVRDFYSIRHLGGGRCAIDVLEGSWLPEKPSLAEAKAAAQADYERRILSALSPSPAVSEPEPFGPFKSPDGDTKCGQCGRANPVWHAPNATWNRAIGGPDATDDPGGVLCPVCFIAKAEEAGIRPTGWLVAPEAHAVSVQEAARVLQSVPISDETMEDMAEAYQEAWDASADRLQAFRRAAGKEEGVRSAAPVDWLPAVVGAFLSALATDAQEGGE